MTAKEYQIQLFADLSYTFPEEQIKNEWSSFRGHGQNQYSPKVDIAVGPFSIIAGENKIREYDELCESDDVRFFLSNIYEFHRQNVNQDALVNELIVPDFDILIKKNRNARCFIAFEIENSNSKKHILGSLINAASLGRIGVGVAYSDKSFKTFIRMLNYLAFLKRVKKNSYDTTNFLIVKHDQLSDIIQKQRMQEAQVAVR